MVNVIVLFLDGYQQCDWKCSQTIHRVNNGSWENAIALFKGGGHDKST